MFYENALRKLLTFLKASDFRGVNTLSMNKLIKLLIHKFLTSISLDFWNLFKGMYALETVKLILSNNLTLSSTHLWQLHGQC